MAKYQIREKEYGYQAYRKVWWWPFWYSISAFSSTFEHCEDKIRWEQEKDARRAAPKNRWTFPPNVPRTWQDQLRRGSTMPPSDQEREQRISG